MPTEAEILTPPPDTKGQRPAWLDDPDMTQIDFAAIGKVADSVQAGLAQQMVNRQSDGTDPFAVADSTINEGVQVHPITKEPLTPTPSLSAIDADALAAQQATLVGSDAASGAPSQTVPPEAAPSTTTDPELLNITLGTNPDGTPQLVSLTQDQARQLVYTYQWLEAQPPAIKQQWAAIQQGQAQAIPTADLQRYQAIQQQNAQLLAAQQQPVAPPAPVAPTRPDLSYLDPEARAYVERMEALAAQQSRTDAPPAVAAPLPVIAQQFPQQQPPPQAQFNTTLDIEGEIRRREQMTQVTAAAVAKYQLSDAQVARLQASVANQGIIPRLMEQQAIRSPLGDIIRHPDFGQVLDQAYESVMVTDPQLRPIYDNHLVSTRLAQSTAISQGVQSKKAAAGSLASAAPAAVPSAPANPAHMNMQQTISAISQFLQENQATAHQ